MSPADQAAFDAFCAEQRQRISKTLRSRGTRIDRAWRYSRDACGLDTIEILGRVVGYAGRNRRPLDTSQVEE